MHDNFVFLPWLTRKDGVTLAREEDPVLHEEDVENTVVTLAYLGREKLVFLLQTEKETSLPGVGGTVEPCAPVADWERRDLEPCRCPPQDPWNFPF
jgi:hypothetical protein